MKTGHKKALGSFPTLKSVSGQSDSQTVYDRMLELSDMLTTPAERYIVVAPELVWDMRLRLAAPKMKTIRHYLRWANGGV